MHRRVGCLVSIISVITGLFLVYLGASRPVLLIIDGQRRVIYSRALTTGQILQEAGFLVGPSDQLMPPYNHWAGWRAVITLDRSSQVQIYHPVRGLSKPFLSLDHLPGNLLLHAGIRLFPQDQLYWNGLPLPPDYPLPPAPSFFLQVRPAIAVQLIEDSKTGTFYSAASGVIAALWQHGVVLTAADRLSLSADTPLKNSMTVEVTRAILLTIRSAGREIRIPSAAGSVGQALAEAGITLQGMDYSIPGEAKPLPKDGAIRVIRVQEKVIINQTLLPFQSEYVPDPDLELDQRRVLEAGQAGIRVARQRIRLEDGVEVSRQVDAEWVVAEPKSEKIGYGTKVVIRTLDTPGGQIKYWRVIPAYATSYSPCRQGPPGCSDKTASGLKLKKGVVGVASAYYRQLAGLLIYVPGYGEGVIGDFGAGIPDKFLVDLGYGEDDFQPWHQDVTLYFLTPVPDTIQWILP